MIQADITSIQFCILRYTLLFCQGPVLHKYLTFYINIEQLLVSSGMSTIFRVKQANVSFVCNYASSTSCTTITPTYLQLLGLNIQKQVISLKLGRVLLK